MGDRANFGFVQPNGNTIDSTQRTSRLHWSVITERLQHIKNNVDKNYLSIEENAPNKYQTLQINYNHGLY